jgi:two-component system, OmpR family, phosphate regulon response regulator PhoB
MKALSEKTILIIEDETSIRDMLCMILHQAKFNTLEAENSKKAFDLILKKRPDLVLLDWMLPGTSGIDVARLLKANQETAKIPIILLTARATEDSKIEGFSVGIDDYIVKPFSPRELVARINAVLRRVEKVVLSENITVDELTIDPNIEVVSISGQEIKLNQTEYRLLLFFFTSVKKVYTRSNLLNQVWPHTAEIDERTVDVTIKRLRQALGPKFCMMIKTVRGSGYCFNDLKK